MTTLSPLIGKQKWSCQLATARINVWEGAVRSSKTVSSLIKWIEYVRTGPAGNLLMVGKTERTLKRNIIDPIIEWLGNKRARFIQGSGEFWILGRRVYVAGANDERAQDRIRGLTLAGAYVDEATTLPESFWTMLMSRLSVEGAQVFATTNPDSKQHWFMTKWLAKASLWLKQDGTVERSTAPEKLDLHRFSFQLADNPHMPQSIKDSLAREYVGLWHRRFIKGEWVVAEGAVFDMWDEDRHVVAWDKLPRIDRWVGLGIDHGTRNPFAAILLGLSLEQRMVYAVDEWRWDSKTKRKQLTNPEYSRLLTDWLRNYRRPGEPDNAIGVVPEWVCVDPSAADFKLQMFNDGWGSVTNADNDVLQGIQAVAAGLSGDWLRISDRCVGLLDEIPSYSWDDKAAKAGEDKPVKVADHSMDGLRYGTQTTRWSWRDYVGSLPEKGSVN